MEILTARIKAKAGYKSASAAKKNTYENKLVEYKKTIIRRGRVCEGRKQGTGCQKFWNTAEALASAVWAHSDQHQRKGKKHKKITHMISHNAAVKTMIDEMKNTQFVCSTCHSKNSAPNTKFPFTCARKKCKACKKG